jgi:putative copper resistance protein D
VVLLLLLLGWLAWSRRRQVEGNADAAGAGLAAAVLVSQVWAGHATAGPPSHVAADAVHLAAAALWVGSLPPLLAVLGRTRAGGSAWTTLGALAARGFSGLGMLAVAALAVTGFVNGRMMVGSLDALATTSYGRLVAIKLVLFSLMLALAAANRFRLSPRLASGHAQAGIAARRLWRNVAVELALGACIFAVVGLLGGGEPPAHAPAAGMRMQHG